MSDDKAAVEKLHQSYKRMKEELAQVIVGQDQVVEQAVPRHCSWTDQQLQQQVVVEQVVEQVKVPTVDQV